MAYLISVFIDGNDDLPPRTKHREADSKYTWKTQFSQSRSSITVIGEEIRKSRIAAGLSQEALGFKAKVSRNYVSMVELNQNSPTLDILIRICNALGVRAATLVARHEKDAEEAKPVKRRKS